MCVDVSSTVGIVFFSREAPCASFALYTCHQQSNSGCDYFLHSWERPLKLYTTLRSGETTGQGFSECA